MTYQLARFRHVRLVESSQLLLEPLGVAVIVAARSAVDHRSARKKKWQNTYTLELGYGLNGIEEVVKAAKVQPKRYYVKLRFVVDKIVLFDLVLGQFIREHRCLCSCCSC